MRHRRRCKGPRMSKSRRKACDACVLAKARCCYTQPNCTRCSKRGIRCVYPTYSATSTLDHPGPLREATEIPSSTLRQSPSSGSANLATSRQPFELDLPTWDFSASPYSLDNFDMTMADLERPLPAALSSFTVAQSSIAHNSREFTPSSQTLSLSATTANLAPPLSNSTSSSAAAPSPATSVALIRMLSEYPSLLMKGSFLSPFLHLSLYSLYNNFVPDMTLLPQTSMAICCSSGINSSDSKRFFRRAIDAARQRVIGSFVSTPRSTKHGVLTCQSADVPMYATMGCTTCHVDL